MTFENAISKASILIADNSVFTRKLARSMLLNMGARAIHEANDGVAALDAIRRLSPDVMIINWDLPALDGHEVVRIVRSPDDFPKPDLPIIMLTDIGLHSRIVKAFHVGAHEILLKPFSPLALEQRLQSILLAPRPMLRTEGRYYPEPRHRANMEQLMEAGG